MENKFSIGEKVISLSNSSLDRKYQQRKKGEIYKVTDVTYCPSSGMQLVNIGQNVPNGMDKTKYVCMCGKIHSSGGQMWSDNKDFAKIDYSTLKEVVENEEYELACIIRDNL